jgi:hypothetical protein
MLFMLLLPLLPANEKSTHSARVYAAQALISAHPAKEKDYRLQKIFPQPRSADKLLIYYPQRIIICTRIIFSYYWQDYSRDL